ncbi:MAG: hypothetical protein JXR94_08465 [Candidatus Hydrogenedentes bacterium]|nr:hypothetical protein [Candidatus Hydrogenedentota bacterium]
MRRRTIATLLMAALIAAAPAAAWGPKADRALVDTAGRVIAKEGLIPLTNLQKDILNGATTPPSRLEEIIPGASDNPISAIESEMYLLQAVRGDRVDPYFAYRLGVLGKLVAMLSAPLSDESPTYRNLYYADVENNIDRIPLTPTERQVIDPITYLPRIQRQAALRKEVILKEYQAGIGFKGAASQSLAEDASRTVNAVADVWYTVLQGHAVVTNVPQTRLRDYVLDSLRFYIDRGNRAETRTAYRQLLDLGLQNPDVLKQIGDMFFEANEFERAMDEYESVLALAPNRRDVVARIAEYYVQVGDKALDAGELDNARSAYVRALDADKLHPTAQAKLIDVEKLIAERSARLEATRAALEQARELEGRADQHTFSRNYDEAISLLLQARAVYMDIGAEFQKESIEARTGLNRISDGLSRLKEALINNAGALSGSGMGSGVRALAGDAAERMAEESLHAIVEQQYRDELSDLQRRYRDSLKPGARY